MKTSKRLAALLLCLALLVLGSISAAALEIPEPDPELLYVTDNAGVLSSGVENDIANRNDALYEATGAQFAILTIDSLPAGYDSESYCYEVFNAWGVGDQDKHNGILLLLVPGEGKFWMVTGTGLQSHLTGGTLSDLLDEYLADDFDAGRYDAGVTALFDAVWQELEDIYGPIDTTVDTPQQPQPDYDYNYDDYYGYEEENNGSFWIGLLVILIIVVIIVACSNRPGRRYYGGSTPPPPAPGAPPYYRTYNHPRPQSRPVRPHTPPIRPSRPPYGGFGSGYGYGGFGSSRPSSRPSRPSSSWSSRPSRPSSGGFGSSRPSGGFGSSRPSGGASRSFGGGRSHGGGGGRR